MSEELDVLKLVCMRLERAEIPYMLTGSVAGNFYIIPRMTRDIDIVLDGAHIWIVSPEDLIISKLEWAKDSLSDMQLTDVRNLLLGESLDREYLNQWVQRLGLHSIYERVTLNA